MSSNVTTAATAPPTTAKVVNVHIISDILCPWCWVGKRSLELAAEKSGVTLQVEWLPFQLDPRLPKEGTDKIQAYIRKFGAGAEKSFYDPNSQLKVHGRSIGLEFKYHEGSKVFNSFDGHRLLTFAKTKFGLEKQNALQEVLFERYFRDGVNLGLNDELISAAKQVGLDENSVRSFLESDELADVVRKELTESHYKVNSVPSFFFPSGQTISGGQPVDKLAALLRKESQ